MKYSYKAYNQSSRLIPLILLHGWGGSLQSLNPLGKELSIQLKNPVYVLELPGFGNTQLIKQTMRTADYAQFLWDFLKTYHIDKCILIGHSFGGKTSIAFTLTYPEVVDKLILINSSGIKPKNSLKRYSFKLISALAPDRFKHSGFIRKLFYKKIVHENDYLYAGKLKTSLSAIVNEHFDYKLSNIKHPCLIIWSSKDKAVPLWMGRKLNTLIHNSTLKIIKNTTHGLPLKDPCLTAKTITEFLSYT